MSGLLVSLWLAMQIDVAGSCPSTADVEERLVLLLPPGFAADSTDRAVVTEDSGGLNVALARRDGRTAAHRHLPRSGSCAEQAEAVAVTLAVWETQIHSGVSLRLDRLAFPSAPASVPPANPELTIAGSSEPPRAHAFAAALGAGALGSWQPDSLAPGGIIAATLGRAESSWRARFAIAGLGTHTLNLAPGEASWWRAYVALGADHVLPVSHRWQLALGVAGVVGALTASGSGFSSDRTTRSLDLGAEAVARVEWQLASVRPWIGVAVLTWLRRQTVEITGEAASTVLPRFEPLLALGGDFCWRP
jgi:hypothetical protein